MRILIATPVFLPRLGGVEIFIDCLARGFQAAGHEVRVATSTGEETESALPYPVLRRPGVFELFREARRCDVALQNVAGLRLLLPLLAAGCPLAIVHHNWLPPGGDRGFRRWTLTRGRNITVSSAIAAHLPVPSVVIPNCHRGGAFADSGGERPYDLCCAARFVSDKGVDLLIEALRRLAGKELRPRLLLVGDGPERAALERQVAEAGLTEQVAFAGFLEGAALAEALNRARVLVVPSRFREPFGIVALEGIACGCYLVGADGGGLGEAIGPCGETFPRGDAGALAATLERLLTQGVPEVEAAAREAHLAAHSRERIAARYLELLEDLAGAAK